jgi:hypothetical protein
MKNRFFDQLSSVADEWLSRGWLSVEPGSDGEGSGGAPTPPSPTTAPAPAPAHVPASSSVDGNDETALGDAGKRALDRIRAEKDEIKRQLAEAKAQLEDMKPYIPPDKYKEMLDKYEATQREARERELELQKQKSKTEEEFQTRLIEVNNQRDAERRAREDAEARASAERDQRLKFAKRTILSAAFYANGGREGQDDEGTTFLDLFMNARGDARTEYDETDGQVYVVDKEGKRVLSADGKPQTLGEWMKDLADTNPIVGGLFAPRGGSGSGGLQGARGVKAVQTKDPASGSKHTPNDYLAEAYPDRRRN